MKKVLTALAISFSFGIALPAQAHLGQSLCQYIKADDKIRLRNLLKTNKIKIRSIFDDARCNGQNLLEFASAHNAVETGSMIISKLPRRTVSSVLPQISSAELASAAQQRIDR